MLIIILSNIENAKTAENSRKKLHFQRSSKAIIAILAGMLLPALNAARQKAKAITCLSNLKGNMSATQQYADDYSSWAPPAYTASWNLPKWANYVPGKNDECRWAAFLMLLGYNRQYKSFHCPVMDANIQKYESIKNESITKSVAAFQTVTYGMTGNIGPTQYLTRLLKIQNAGVWVLYSDSAYFMTFSGVNTLVPSSYIVSNISRPDFSVIPAPSSPQGRGVHLAHSKRGNAAFVDGHASACDNRDYLKSNIQGGFDEFFRIITF